jgi:hypothetical protein
VNASASFHVAFRSRSRGCSRFKRENADKQNFSKEEHMSEFKLVCLMGFLSTVSFLVVSTAAGVSRDFRCC